MITRLITLLALCLPVLIHAQTLTTFVAQKNQAYAEVSIDGRIQKIYTESYGDNKALLVLGEKNNPELLKFSFVDASKKVVSVVVEFRTEKGVSPAGREAAENEFIKSLNSDDEGFRDWQARYSTFPEQSTSAMVLTDGGFADPVADEIVDGGSGGFVFRLRDFLCHCRDGRVSGLCLPSAVRCVLDNLCTVWDCVEAEYWTPECHTALEYARACAGEIEE